MDSRILEAIDNERNYQVGLWGEQNHNLHFWNTILVEEVGEVAKAILGEPHTHTAAELIQVAAVATQILECMFRNGMIDEIPTR